MESIPQQQIRLSPIKQTCLHEEFIGNHQKIVKRTVALGDDLPHEQYQSSKPQIGDSLTLLYSVKLITLEQMMTERDQIVLEVLAKINNQQQLLVSNKSS